MKEEVPTALVQTHIKRIEDSARAGMNTDNHLLDASGIAGTIPEPERQEEGGDGAKTDGAEGGSEAAGTNKETTDKVPVIFLIWISLRVDYPFVVC